MNIQQIKTRAKYGQALSGQFWRGLSPEENREIEKHPELVAYRALSFKEEEKDIARRLRIEEQAKKDAAGDRTISIEEFAEEQAKKGLTQQEVEKLENEKDLTPEQVKAQREKFEKTLQEAGINLDEILKQTGISKDDFYQHNTGKKCCGECEGSDCCKE